MKTQTLYPSDWVFCFLLTIFFGFVLMGTATVRGQSPDSANFPTEKILLRQMLPERPYAAARCDMATLKNDGKKNNGYVIIEYIKIIEEDIHSGQKKEILVERYADRRGSIGPEEAGLYTRNPKWFADNYFSLLSNSYYTSEGLVINVGQEPNRISHLYTHWVKCRPNTRNLVEVKLLVSGEIGFQIGLDYCNREIDDCSQVGTHDEAFVSQWINDTFGNFEVLTIPDYETQTFFDSSHYGVTSDGLFFISKELVEFFNGTFVELKIGAFDWAPKEMHLSGDWYILETHIAFFQPTFFCFMINKAFHLPEYNKTVFVNQSDIVPHSKGSNFRTMPVSE